MEGGQKASLPEAESQMMSHVAAGLLKQGSSAASEREKECNEEKDKKRIKMK
jgi:hypothetical protein